jgi:DNA-binding NtrC family response regulator
MATTKCSVLLVDDDPYIVFALSSLLASDAAEFEALTATTPEAAQCLFAEREIDVILTDPGLGMAGVSLLHWVRDHHPKTVRLFMTASHYEPAQLKEFVEAGNSGLVFQYLYKPFSPDEMLNILRLARTHRQTQAVPATT